MERWFVGLPGERRWCVLYRIRRHVCACSRAVNECIPVLLSSILNIERPCKYTKNFNLSGFRNPNRIGMQI
jgi:hypothetical protein